MKHLLNPKVLMLLTATIVSLTLTPALCAQGGPPTSPPRVGFTAPSAPLTAEESKWLVYMREEEKLARDVYRYLYQKWNLTVFDRIQESENRHFGAVGTLLARYGVADPAANDVAGVFSDPKLAALYAELTSKGSVSVKDALEVGVRIEQSDIADLEDALKGATKLDIKRVYTNLLDGSLSHLEAFEANLEGVCLNP